jgi:hypothetical protein
MSGQIFINYRSDDISIAARLYGLFLEHFPQSKILMDVDRGVHGEDLVKTIEKAIESSDVLIAVVGKGWLPGCLEGPDDYVRLELASAFKRNIRVIPVLVLVEGVSMPRFYELPDDLKALARLNALQISDTGFDADYHRLVTAIEQDLEQKELRVLHRAAAARNAIAMDRLYQARDYDKAREWCQEAADAGNPDAMFALGLMYEKGRGLAQDYGKAREWYQKAGDAGNEDATFALKLERYVKQLKAERLEKERPEVDILTGILASGKFPKGAEHRAVNVPGEPERSPVDCTVFAHDRVERKQTGLLQVFVHAPEARGQAEAAARKFDPEAKERGHRSLVLDAPIGTTFAFDVEIEGFVFHEQTDTLLWSGRPQAATFRFHIPQGCKLGQHAGTVRISQDGAPVGRITFQIEVVLDASGTLRRPVGKEARHYHACFCSYSSLDRVEMLKRAEGIRATGLETFIDVLKLRPGGTWAPEIFAAIDKSDLFVLIWYRGRNL